MALGDRSLASSGNERLDQAQRITSPGMITWADPNSKYHCASCAHFYKHHCMKYVTVMRARLRKEKFWGPKLPPGQRACSQYEKLNRQQGGDLMPKVSEKFPKQGLLTAKDLRGQPDLVVTIASVDLDQHLGGERFGDVLHFVEDGRGLVLNQTIAHQIAQVLGKDEMLEWPQSSIALFCDDTVSFKDRMGNLVQGGIRMRCSAPQGNGPTVAVPPPRRSPKDDMDDAIPF
jgi:hypothetical protein